MKDSSLFRDECWHFLMDLEEHWKWLKGLKIKHFEEQFRNCSLFKEEKNKRCQKNSFRVSGELYDCVKDATHFMHLPKNRSEGNKLRF